MASLNELWKVGSGKPNDASLVEGGLGIDTTNKVVYSKGSDGLVFKVGAVAESVQWTGVLGLPTTVAGYGISDAYTKAEVDSAISSATPTFSTLVGLPTTVAGYGISDAYNTKASLIPETTGVHDIGSPDKRFKAIYVDEAYLSTNTLYIGDTPVLGTDQDTIVIKADVDQSINISTLGLGSTNIASQSQITLGTSGTNADIRVQAIGTNSKVRFSGSGGIELSNDTAVQANLSVTGGLTVSGDLTVNGAKTIVNSTTVTTKDNVIVLNNGEVGSGVTAGKAGLRVDRGELADFEFIFDETDDKFKVGAIGGTYEILASRDWVNSSLLTKANVATTLSGYGITDAYTKAEVDGNISTAINDLAEEVTRAKAAEGALTTNLANEVTRAKAAEGVLTTDLASEVTRANAAEGVLTNDLASEVTRAKAAEGALTTNLANEVTRANAAEGVLTTDLASEVTRAKAAEGNIQGQIDIINGASTVEGSFRKAIADVVAAAPEALNTLGEIATQLANDENAAAALTTVVSTKAPLASPTFTGTVTLPSATSIGTITSTELGYIDGVTSNVQTQLNAKAPLASPTFTGTVTGSFSGNLNGTSSSATKLATARTITLSGGVSGSASFDGSDNVSISATVSSSSTNVVSTIVSRDASGDFAAGTITATNFNSLSDANLKENVKDIDSSKLFEVRPVEFTWKDSGEKAFGVIAQELEEVLPELVITNEIGIKSVTYTELIPFLVKAVQELKAEVEYLKNK